jgi:short-subunit dehydrogenase
MPAGRADGSQSRTVLITGASAGIGDAFARVFAGRGWHLVITARREDRLIALKNELESAHGIVVRAVAADLSDAESPKRIFDELTRAGVVLDGIVNNAGYGVAGTLLKSSWEVHAASMQVLVTAVVELTYRFLPGMLDRGFGRIVNVASVAGMLPPVAGHTLYGASKAFVIKFSQSVAAEVRARGVNVTALCPGFTYSEFHDVLGTRDQVKRFPSWMWMDARTVAEQGYDAVMSGRAVHVTGAVFKTMTTLTKLLPESVVLAATRLNASKFRKT